MNADLHGLVITYLFLFAVVLAGEAMRRLLKRSPEFTRKCIHIGVGFWGYFAWSITSRWLVMIPPLSFVLINLASHRWKLIPAMESDDEGNLGTVYYPLSICIMILLFWNTDLKIIAVLASMVMGLGDGFATIIGRAAGRHSFHVGKNKKTWEGSLSMFLFSCAACLAVLLPLADVTVQTALLRSGAVALVAAAAEGATPGGYDNLSVPLAAGLFYYLLFI
ncbi:hypothetical protein JXO52_02705 [bacterium]|nr:hypothetical protein [bacterium]